LERNLQRGVAVEMGVDALDAVTGRDQLVGQRLAESVPQRLETTRLDTECARVLVRLGGLVDDAEGNPLAQQVRAERQSRRPCANNQDLGHGGLSLNARERESECARARPFALHQSLSDPPAAAAPRTSSPARAPSAPPPSPRRPRPPA